VIPTAPGASAGIIPPIPTKGTIPTAPVSGPTEPPETPSAPEPAPIDPVVADSKLEGQPEDVKADVRGLRDRVGQGRLYGRILGYGAIAVAVLALICWGSYYASSTLAYAKVGTDMKLHRDPADPNRLVLDYTPKGTGIIGISRTNGDRTTELLPRTYMGDEGHRRQFPWRVDGLKAGDTVKVTYRKGWLLGTEKLPVPEFHAGSELPAVEEMPGDLPSTVPMDGAALSGRIVSALDGEPISGAEVRIGGTALREKTDAKGSFRIVGIPEGSQKIEVAAAGYAPREFERELTDGMESGYQVALKPRAKGGNIRIALNWGSEGEDLDAHMEGPLPKGGKFHIDRHHPGTDETKGVVALATDDRDDGGSETIEVTKVVPGTYRYFVHDFANRHDPAGRGLSRSGAEVTVSYGGESYRFHPKRKGKGNLWDVCTIVVTDDGGVVNRIDAFQGIKPELLGLYDRRTQGDRDTWITNYGGSVASEEAVTDALDWLARHQGPDGFWSSECLAGGQWSQCKGGHCDEDGHGTKAGRKYEMAQTALALLAFQAGGHYYFNDRKYSDRVRKALDWMVDHQEADGALVSEKDRGGHSRYHTFYMYDHGIATFALADACAAAKALGRPRNDKYYGALKRAVNYIYSQQHEDGGWRYTDDFERYGDTSVTGWQVLALKSAKEAGLEVDYRCIEKIRDFFDKCLMEDHGRTWYENPGSTRKQQSDATTGIGMLVRQFLLNEPDHPSIGKAAPYLVSLAERHKADKTVEDRTLDYKLAYNYYLWYNCTLAMFQAGGEAWDRWNPIIRNTIIGLQRHKGCEKGSWDPDTQWGERGGRIYTTALACLTLETYYRYTRQQKPTGGESELYVVNPGVIPAVVRAEPEPIEFHVRGDDVIKQIAAPKPVFVPRPVVRTPVVVPPATVVQRPVVVPPATVVQRPVVPATPPLPKRSVKVGGAKIITVGAAKYGDIQIEAEIEEKPTTFQLTLTTIRPGAAASVPLQPHEFGFRLVDATGRKVPLQTPPTAGPVQETGSQILRGKMIAQLGPRGTITITDLHKLTLSYKGHVLEHSLQTQYR